MITSVSTLSPYLNTFPNAFIICHLLSLDLQYILQSRSLPLFPVMQIDQGVYMPHSSDKIPVRCRYAFLSRRKDSHMSSHADRSWSVESASCIDKDIYQSFFDTFFVDFLCTRYYHDTHIRMYLCPFKIAAARRISSILRLYRIRSQPGRS